MSMYPFWKRWSFVFGLKNKIIFSRKETSYFLKIQARSYCSKIIFFFERPSFQNIGRKYYISMYFFLERSSFILRLKNKIIFWGKRNIIIPDNTRNIFRGILLGRQSFQNIWKKGIWFYVQCISPTTSLHHLVSFQGRYPNSNK